MAEFTHTNLLESLEAWLTVTVGEAANLLDLGRSAAYEAAQRGQLRRDARAGGSSFQCRSSWSGWASPLPPDLPGKISHARPRPQLCGRP